MLIWAPRVAHDRHGHPKKPQSASDDAVCDLPPLGIGAKLQTKAAVDDAQGDDSTSEPNVGASPKRPDMLLLVDKVMD